jgi:PAS domain S-box-containing protein
MSKAHSLEQFLSKAQARLRTILEQAAVTSECHPLMTAAFYELSVALEELQIAAEELHHQNETLVRTQQALIEERGRYQRRYQQILDAIPDLIFVKDRNSRLVWANQALRDFYGMTLEEIQGIVDTVFSTPELTRQYLEDDAVVFDTGEILNIPEESIVRHDGTLQSFTTVKSPIRNEQGEITELVGVCRDITEQKQAQEQLRQSEEKFRHFAENSHAVVWMTRPDLRDSTYVNPAYERVWGRSRQSLIDHPDSWLEAVHPDDRNRVQAKMGHQLPTNPAIDEYRIIRPDGSIRWIRDQGFAMRNEAGEIYGFGGLAEDITDKKQLELSLAASETQKSQILNSAVASIVSFRVYRNRGYDYDFYSNGCEILYGYSAEEFMANKHLWMSRVEPEDLSGFLDEAYRNFFAEQNFTTEFRFHHKDGSIRWIASTHTSQKIAEDCWQVTAVNHDITQRKQAQVELQHQILREKLITSITQDVRQSLDLDSVLFRTVRRVRKILKTDRVIILRLQPDWRGKVVMESVRDGYPSILNYQINDPCISERYAETCKQGRIAAIEDLEQANIQPFHRQLLRQFQVKANLVAPLLHDDTLWGLLIAHECSAPRPWQDLDIDLMKQIAAQVSIAIQQSELYEQTRRQLLEIEAIYNMAPIGLGALDNNLRFLRVNEYLAKTNGLPIDEHLGRSPLEVVPQLAPTLEPIFHHLLETGQPIINVEITGETPAQPGSPRTWLESWIPLKDSSGAITGVNLVVLETTRRKEIDAKLREQAALLDISSDAIFVRDLDHRILYWNRGAEAMYGWTAEEAMGQRVDKLLRCGRERLAEITQELSSQGAWQGEIKDYTKDGKPLTVLARWTLVTDQAGQPESILSVITDITKRKQLEQQFYQAQRFEALGTLTAGIAHDLNNVLSPILAMAQLLSMTQQQLDPDAKEQLQLIEQSAKRGATMVKRILTLTRGSSEDSVAIAVWPIVKEAATIVRKSFPTTIAVSLIPFSPALGSPGELTVMADPTALHQVIMNLCINARDAMPNGGELTLAVGKLHVDSALANLHLDAQEGDYVEIAVTDTGTGIDPEVRDRIFDPFFTTKETGKGTGLGLAMVQGIVKNYGGFLWVNSQVGQGTHISVYLPLLKGGQPGLEKTSTSPTTKFHGRGQLILVVEDDPSVQLTTQSLLEAHDYRTHVASDGYEALDYYRQHQTEVQLVLLDITMPGMDGIELIQRLKEINPAVKVVAISGLVSNRQPSLEAGASAFLAKPYSLKALLGSSHRLLSE